MFSVQEHLENLVRHIELVREATLLLGRRLSAAGRVEFGRILIANGHQHDVSKFHGIEWKYLHRGKDVPKDELELAIAQHVQTNPHHPEFWGGFENMPEIYVAEMVCDWYARSMEFGTGLRDWINEEGVPRFAIDITGRHYQWVTKFVDLLLQDSFNRDM